MKRGKIKLLVCSLFTNEIMQTKILLLRQKIPFFLLVFPLFYFIFTFQVINFYSKLVFFASNIKKISTKSFSNVLANFDQIKNINQVYFFSLKAQSILQEQLFFQLFYLLDPDPHHPSRNGSRRSPMRRIRFRNSAFEIMPHLEQ